MTGRLPHQGNCQEKEAGAEYQVKLNDRSCQLENNKINQVLTQDCDAPTSKNAYIVEEREAARSLINMSQELCGKHVFTTMQQY